MAKRKAPTLLNRRALAERLEVHPQTVVKWQEEGMPVAERGGKGRASLYDEARRAAAAKGPAVDLVAERARKERAQAVEAEQRVAIKAREYRPIGEYTRVWQATLEALKTAILTTYLTKADQVHRAGVLAGVAGVEAELKAIALGLLRELGGEAWRAEVAGALEQAVAVEAVVEETPNA
jgi:hypothetical protein